MLEINPELNKRNKSWYVTFPAKIKWATGLAIPGKYGKWDAPFWPDNEGLEMIRDLQAKGLKNVIKKDEDGYYVRFGRKTSRDIRGKPPIQQAPPVVVSDDGETLMDAKTIGNGSDVTVRLRVYEHATPSGGKAVAAELVGIRVDNHIPFKASSDFEPGTQRDKMAQGLADAPRPTW